MRNSKNERPEDFLDKIPISLFLLTMSHFITEKVGYAPCLGIEEFKKMLLREINAFSRKVHPVNLGYIEDVFLQHKGSR